MPDVDREPVFEQIAEHYRRAIRRGELRAGEEMSSVRAMAYDWSVATKTAARALALLRDEGWVQTRPGMVALVAGDPPE